MARTKRTLRGRLNDDDDGLGAPDAEEQMEMNGQLTEEERRRRDELEKAPMQAELKHLERRWTKKGRGYITEPKDDEDLPEEKFNWYEKFALCVTRQYDQSNEWVQRTSLQVNSPALKAVLRDVIGDFPGISFHTKDITIDFPPRCLYHYLPELKTEFATYNTEDPESDESKHLPILLDFIREEFNDAITEGDNLREKGLMSYEHLWTIFKPGSLIYSMRLSQPRVFKLRSYQYSYGNCPALHLNVEFLDFDGDCFGTRGTLLVIPQFSGTVPIGALLAFPLSYHSNEAAVRERIIARGRRWESHAGQQFREYKGVALDVEGLRYNIDGRVMIDAHTFHRIEANHSFQVQAFPGAPGEKRKQALESEEMELVPEDNASQWVPLTDEQCLLATPLVRGFSFTEKKFLEFFIDKITPIEWNTRCFQQLVLPEDKKELVQALVDEHTRRTTDPKSAGFDDIVKGKGRGLILVLHGPPGVGKTLTAECVAEFSKRPLYIVSSGDLGTHSTVLDEKLGRALDLASTWKAVLLIDEADVFLERRSLHDMERNSLVSIFLRALEYYSGILFMTTNRVRTFDDAFKSRIHVPLRYDELPHHSRVKIWKNFMESIGDAAENLDDAAYDELAQGRLNGRQIKNVIGTAKSLAAHKKKKLGYQQLKQVMEIQKAFERELDGADGDIDMVER